MVHKSNTLACNNIKLGTHIGFISPNNFKPAQQEVGYFGLCGCFAKPAFTFLFPPLKCFLIIPTKLLQSYENTLKMLNCERISNMSNSFPMARDYVKKRIRKCLISSKNFIIHHLFSIRPVLGVTSYKVTNYSNYITFLGNEVK